MIKLYTWDNNQLLEKPIGEMNMIKPLQIVDVIDPTNQDLTMISEKTGISMNDILTASGSDKQPRVIDLEKYGVVIFKVPYLNENAFNSESLSIYLHENLVIIVRKGDMKCVDTFLNLSKEEIVRILSKGTSRILAKLLNIIVKEYYEIIDFVEEDIDNIEEKVLGVPSDKDLKKIFVTKKTLIFLHKALAGNREVLSHLERDALPLIKKTDIKHYQQVYYDIIQLMDLQATYTDILTGTMDVYISKQSYHMNVIIKRLTVVASLVLLPTLIASIYGMNFHYMPELSWKYGYFVAWGAIIISGLLTFIMFKRLQWAD